MEEIIKCYFSNNVEEAFIVRYKQYKGDRLRCHKGFVCYYCNDYGTAAKALEKHLKVCARKPGIIYNFNNTHLSTFEDNFRLMGEQPFSVYFDLETTCAKDKIFDFDDDHLTDMYVVSYCFVVMFHKSYSLNKSA